MGKVTIEDISRTTGLSRGTVSRALNNRPDISVTTKQRVLEACRELNYVPSHAARSLATGRCYAVAVVVDDLRTGFAASFVRGVLEHAQEARYAVHVTELGPDAVSAVRHLCTIANERVDGVLLAATLTGELMRQLKTALEEHPLIACSPVDGVACDVFQPDQAEAGRLVARHLLGRSGQSVLYVHRGGGDVPAQRLAGFQEVCREQGLDPDRLTAVMDSADGWNSIRDRLSGVRAIAASDDFLAVELMLRAATMGRTPGRDIAVMGQGNEILGTKVWPTLSTVDLCGEEIGRRAIETVIQRATKTRQDAPQETRVTPLLIERESTRLVGA